MAIDEIMGLVNARTDKTLDVQIEEAKNKLLQVSTTGVGTTVFEYNKPLNLTASSKDNHMIIAKFIAPIDGVFKVLVTAKSVSSSRRFLAAVWKNIDGVPDSSNRQYNSIENCINTAIGQTASPYYGKFMCGSKWIYENETAIFTFMLSAKRGEFVLLTCTMPEIESSASTCSVTQTIITAETE